MKLLITLAALAVAVSGVPLPIAEGLSGNDVMAVFNHMMHNPKATINEGIINTIECFRRDIPEPMEMEHVDANFEIGTLFELEGSVDDINVSGIKSFLIQRINFGIISLKLDFAFALPKVTMTGNYDLNGAAVGFIPIFGKGPFTIVPSDIKFSGHLKLRVFGGFLELSEFELVPSMDEIYLDIKGLLGGGDISDLLNELLMDILPGLLNYWQPALTAAIRTVAMDLANPILNQMTLGEILEMLGGESENCMPELL